MNEPHTKSALLAALIGLGRAAEGNKNRPDSQTHQVLLLGLKMLSDTNITKNEIKGQIVMLHEQKYRLAGRCLTCKKQCGRNDDYELLRNPAEPERITALKCALLALTQMMGSIIDSKGTTTASAEVLSFLYDALYWLGKEEEVPALLSEIEKGSTLLREVLV